MKTPSYRLSDSYTINAASNLILPEGAYVNPLHISYVPKHILESAKSKYFNKDTETFVYCHFGIIPIPTKLIKEVK